MVLAPRMRGRRRRTFAINRATHIWWRNRAGSEGSGKTYALDDHSYDALRYQLRRASVRAARRTNG